MKVVILCGGKGTRLREETEFKPKALIEIGGMPIVEHIMRHYSSYGHNDFILCLGYKGQMIRDYFMTYEFNKDFYLDLNTRHHEKLDGNHVPNWKITFAYTGIESATGYRIKQIQKYINDENFFLTYCDGLSNIDLNKLLQYHISHGKTATVTTVRPITRFGNLVLDENHRVLSFDKRPVHHQGWIDGGFFVLRKDVFKYLKDDLDLEFEAEPLKKLAEDGQFSAYNHDSFWQCMDTLRDYDYLNELWRSGSPPWKILQ